MKMKEKQRKHMGVHCRASLTRGDPIKSAELCNFSTSPAKEKRLESKGDTNGVSVNDTPMLKSVRDTDEQVLGRHECRSLVLAHAASTVLVLSGGGRWRRSRDKDKYSDSDKYQMSGVRWCRVMGVARLTTIWLPAGTEWRDKGSLGQPSRKGLNRDWGSVARASILDCDLLEVPKGKVVRGSTAQRSCRWVNPVTRKGTPFTIATRLLWSSRVSSGDHIFSIGVGNRAYWFSCASVLDE
ncbi:hypothetical protein TIFTF001_009654 [Ficus carica]|uniref:Uncharacterized protein n=1 Tax=Ficus carica TaxID=3494 RepID=A0AA87ZQA9_FICCA|nr:hypothetical protein TIFTF001_009654 [Ficus carica]